MTRLSRLFAWVFRHQVSQQNTEVFQFVTQVFTRDKSLGSRIPDGSTVSAPLTRVQREERDDQIDQQTRDADHDAGDGQCVALLASPPDLVESHRA